MKNRISISALILTTILLSSCWTWSIEPNLNTWTTWNEKIDDINTQSQLYIDKNIDYKNNLAVKEEINDRQKWYEEINENKEYLQSISVNLENKINDLEDYIEVTRQLLVVDLKIVNAIQNWFLDEKSINDNNYFYKMLREKDKSERVKILTNIEWLITMFDNKKVFTDGYYYNLDLQKVDKLTADTKIIYDYTNYYLSNVKYNLDFKTNINLILKSFDALKIDKFWISQTSSGFMKSKQTNYIFESALKNLQKNILIK